MSDIQPQATPAYQFRAPVAVPVEPELAPVEEKVEQVRVPFSSYPK